MCVDYKKNIEILENIRKTSKFYLGLLDLANWCKALSLFREILNFFNSKAHFAVAYIL